MRSVPTSGDGERDWAVPLAPHPCPVSPSTEMIRFEARSRADATSPGMAQAYRPAAGAHKFDPPYGPCRGGAPGENHLSIRWAARLLRVPQAGEAAQNQAQDRG